MLGNDRGVLTIRWPLIPRRLSSTKPNSYSQIVRSSSMIGASQVVTYALGLVRLKVLAFLLGPSGVGLFGYLQSASTLIGTMTSLGVASSGVRDIAAAQATGDDARMGLTVTVLRRVCWITGCAGLFVALVLAFPLSAWSFSGYEQAWAIASLGFALLATAISAGQTALIQGLRRIAELAKINIAGAILGTVASVVCYLWLGENGIAPGLVVGAAFTLLCSWWFARRVPVPVATLPIAKTWAHARPLIKLGLAFAWSGLLVAGVGLLTRSIIIRELGLEANGLYQAGWAISGLFAGFILGAMGADFYPRLTAIADDNLAANQLVNEQTEIGLLLALPGLVGTLAFGPEILRMLYSADFIPVFKLFPWFVLGVLGRVVSWPLGYLILAKGAARWFFITETTGNCIGAIALIFLLYWKGLVGVAVAFSMRYIFYTTIVFLVCRHLTGFRWSKAGVTLMIVTMGALGLVLILHQLADYWRLSGGAIMLLSAAAYSLCTLAWRLGPDHRLSRYLFPLMRRIKVLKRSQHN